MLEDWRDVWEERGVGGRATVTNLAGVCHETEESGNGFSDSEQLKMNVSFATAECLIVSSQLVPGLTWKLDPRGGRGCVAWGLLRDKGADGGGSDSKIPWCARPDPEFGRLRWAK